MEQRISRLSEAEKRVTLLEGQLEEANSISQRLQRESEYVVENINKWVDEQKYFLNLEKYFLLFPVV